VRLAEEGMRMVLCLLVQDVRAFRAKVLIDEDSDGVGEFPGLGEYGGTSRGRIGRNVPAWYLGQWYKGSLNEYGQGVLRDYLLHVWLPGEGGKWVPERSNGFVVGSVDPDEAEKHWRIVAWPSKGSRARKAYLLSDAGTVAILTGCGTGELSEPDARMFPLSREACPR
jgi:hypothetical protein